MLRPDAARTPRDTVATIALLERSEMADGISAAREMVRHLSLHPYPPALSGLIMTNTYLMVRYDTLHVLDGGVTMRILIIAGNFMYYTRSASGCFDSPTRAWRRCRGTTTSHTFRRRFGPWTRTSRTRGASKCSATGGAPNTSS